MSTIFSYWVVALALAGVLALVLEDKGRRVARQVFVVLASVFVIQYLALAAGKEGRLARATPAMEADRAELLLRFGTAMDVAASEFMKSVGGPLPMRTVRARDKDFRADARKALEESLNKNPESSIIKAKIAIVLGEAREAEQAAAARRLAAELSRKANNKDAELGRALSQIYAGGRLDRAQERELERTLESRLPRGWYRNAALLRLYEDSGNSAMASRLRQHIERSSLKLFWNFLAIVLFGVLVAFIGVVLIVIQLCVLPRSQVGADSTDKLGNVPWDMKTVYLVFVFWLATQVVVGHLLQGLARSHGISVAGASALVVALFTAGTYLVSNGPGVLYAYLLAFRPNNLKFSEAVHLKASSGRLGPGKLTLAGVGTWFAAVPVVMVAYFLASKYLGAQGSTNPIISLVLEQARSLDYVAIIIFYLTLGVIAPLFEETLFRGFLYRTLRNRLGVGTSLFASAVAFGGIHMDFGAIVPLTCLGWLFGFVFERTRSLLPAVIAHGLWNSGTFTLVLLIFGG